MATVQTFVQVWNPAVQGHSGDREPAGVSGHFGEYEPPCGSGPMSGVEPPGARDRICELAPLHAQAAAFWPLLRAIRNLTNEQLAQQLRALTKQKQARDADLLLYLSELDQRRLYRQHACGSLFEFCLARLGFSEDAAYKRVGAARMLRQFPLVFELLSEGRIHLSALILLRPHLTQENHREWLMAAVGKSKREVERFVASRCPSPDVPTRVRRLPGILSSRVGSTAEAAASESVPVAEQPEPTMPVDPGQGLAATPAPDMSPALGMSTVPSMTAFSAVSPALPPRAALATKVQPLSAHSYRVVFTASERLKQKMDRAGELVSHAVSPSDLPSLIERALDLLIERAERQRCGSKQASRSSVRNARRGDADESTAPSLQSVEAHGAPQAFQEPQPIVTASPTVARKVQSGPSRYVPAAIRRAVWKRDVGRCTYVDHEGNCCKQTHFLQLDHRLPYALGGVPTLENLRLRCAAHNLLHAEQIYGSYRMAVAAAQRSKRNR
jgi:5-methylcytosine-specific restriction endonuclease McrA